MTNFRMTKLFQPWPTDVNQNDIDKYTRYQVEKR